MRSPNTFINHASLTCSSFSCWAATAKVSKVLSKRRASPSALAINRAWASASKAGTAWMAWALSMMCAKSMSDKGCNTYTAARDNSAEFTSKEGFSVVAPMKVNRPDSTCGKKASCWLLLKRCTSSTNTMVRLGASESRSASALSTASRISFTPPSTALMAKNCASKASAIKRAMVVFPTPGGPHKIQL